MEFRILGPLEVVESGRALALGGSRQRTLLALLLTRANEVVSKDRLIDDLWGASVPDSPVNALQYHVSQLRKALAPGDAIETHGAGYLLRVQPEELDLLRFERLVGEAQQAPPEAAARLLRQALGPVARAGARRSRLRAVRADGDPPPRGASARGAGAADRSRPRARPPRRDRRPRSRRSFASIRSASGCAPC